MSKPYAFYNENDAYAAQWLRNLIKAGHITDGVVDERSIEDITPNDLKGFRRVHLFAGIGVWDYSLNRAGWTDAEVWTGSCPCQPFSVAGKGRGFADERHLWPAMHWLVQQRRPVTVFGEQVASKDGYSWLDTVSLDLENTGYTVGAVVAPAAGFGAPHQRHRMYWVADARSAGLPEFRRERIESKGPSENSLVSGLADTENERHERGGGARGRRVGFADNGTIGRMADTEKGRRGKFGGEMGERNIRHVDGRSDALGGFWSDAEWIYCRDEKYRPVKSSIFPLAHGVAGRVGKLRAAGNAICAPQAEEFIKAYLEVRP